MPPKRYLDDAGPSGRSKKKADDNDQLSVFGIPAAVLAKAVVEWGSPGTAVSSGPRPNSSLNGVIRTVGLDQLKFETKEFTMFGPCSVFYSRSQVRGAAVVEKLKLVEGGSNNDSPRLVFYCLQSK